MNLFSRLIRQNKLFYSLSLLLIIITTLFLSFVSRVEGFIFLNSFHTKTLNLNQRDGGAVSVSYTDTYVFTQGSPSSSWVITHSMNKYPSVTVIDSSNNTVEGEVVYSSLNSLTVNFSGGFSGKAYIN